MIDMNAASLSASLERLKKEVRTLRCWLYGSISCLCLLGGIATLVATTGQAQQPSSSSSAPIRTESLITDRLIVVDANGHARIVLSIADGIGPSVVLYGDDGAGKAMLALSGSGPTLGMFDSAGRSRMRLGITETIGPSVVLKDEQDRPRAIISVTGEKGSLQVLDTSEKPVWQAP